MTPGVSFQPGGVQQGDPRQPQQPRSSGVQEAIKILSLRLPKVVGAQSAAPQALLGSQGSGGNRVDSVVNQVLSRIMPTGQPGSPPVSTTMPVPPRTQPQAPQGAPSFSGDAPASYAPPAMPNWPWTPPQGFSPRVVVDNPVGQGDFMTGPDGRPIGGQPPALIGELPSGFVPPAPDFDLITRVLGGLFNGGGGGASHEAAQLF